MKQGSLSAALLIVLSTQVASAEDCARQDLMSSQICKEKMGKDNISKAPNGHKVVEVITMPKTDAATTQKPLLNKEATKRGGRSDESNM